MERANGTARARWLRALGLVVFTLLVATSCASSGDDSSADGDGGGALLEEGLTSGLVNVEEAPEPQQGGTLTMGMFSPVRSLDPAVITGSGTAGGIELAALYDVLMRFDREADEYVPQLAESLTPNDDFTEWTLKLRPEVTFTDGTPLDAEAVVFNLQRHVDEQNRTGALLNGITFEATDAQTVTFTLDDPWAGFPWLLSWTAGYIASPTAIQADPEGWASNPVGAGPFVLDEFAANEVLSVNANEDYWNGRPNLDQVRFTLLQGAQPTADAILAGDFQAGFVRDPEPVRELIDAGYPGYLVLNNSGEIILLNNGSRGQTDRPTADPRVRLAVRHAVDSEAYNERGYNGQGFPAYTVMGPSSQWSTESSIEPNPEEAQRLVEEVKAEDGWDGSLSIITTVGSEDRALSTQASLNAVGMDVEVDVVPTVSDMLNRVFVDANFDMILWGMSVDDAEPWVAMYRDLSSESATNPSGYASAEMDALLTELRAASDEAETQEVLDEVQALWDVDQPAVNLSQQPDLIAWAPDVYGMVPTVASMVLLDQAFIAD
ncbi:ABC transporter substrate-binding protein [Rhabdothermincola salaria]|uniref:ABC transporter substrate-binding protein n=1 Tax=Rhabdothermincola salaria TaxID=2903142 RepID=UPI001E3BD4E0|nr:ABC transporter substrate-binding protein [Rhabdothermincola salaria]MCD9622747.1 ABC transporter substrate-binding protein [Rhabdothermincola salaria]